MKLVIGRCRGLPVPALCHGVAPVDPSRLSRRGVRWQLAVGTLGKTRAIAPVVGRLAPSHRATGPRAARLAVDSLVDASEIARWSEGGVEERGRVRCPLADGPSATAEGVRASGSGRGQDRQRPIGRLPVARRLS